MNLLDAAKTALAELENLHTLCDECDTPEHCPAACAIRDLKLAISEIHQPITTPPI